MMNEFTILTTTLTLKSSIIKILEIEIELLVSLDLHVEHLNLDILEYVTLNMYL